MANGEKAWIEEQQDEVDSDWIAENTPDNKSSNDLPEAPASATIRVYIDGYSTLLTMRSTKVKDVIAQTEYIVNYAKSKGWKTTWDKEDAKPSQDTCEHKDKTTKVSSGHNKPENKGRKYESCLTCNKFLNWK